MNKVLYYLTAIVLLIAAALTVLFLRDVSSSNEISALNDCTPYNIQYNDILSDSFTVSWKTKGNCSGMVKYGEERDNISFIAMQTGDSSAKQNHTIRIVDLNYSTQYYLLVISNAIEYGNNNSPLIVKTKAL